MNTTSKHQQAIDAFESHYQYDGSYMRELLASSPTAYQLFSDFLPLAHYREQLTLEDYWLAKIAALQTADCGACLQLNIKMAREQGLPNALIRMVIKSDAALPEDLKQVASYARQLVGPEGVDKELMQHMRKRYSQGQLLEFGLCVASATVFPMIKRAIGATQSCSVIDTELA
ncbi:carboxymuconolactone decarboxylase family protein [Agaribacterium haliotis]|uniref:carboxymuconolactone decarboxylase family protein n=1 Tax=Agaribacterium haliotis TaxID=2013869 RepID=UPI000BB542C9|nr:carboxymuconolactone decarboxylase family protein [Agaribacterium haliotis]